MEEDTLPLYEYEKKIVMNGSTPEVVWTLGAKKDKGVSTD